MVSTGFAVESWCGSLRSSVALGVVVYEIDNCQLPRDNSGVTPDEIKLGFLLLQHLRVATPNRPAHKFNVIGRSTRGEFESWLGRDISSTEKQSLIWIWDELKRARLISPTGTDLVNPDDWVVATPKGMTISESEFTAMFGDEPSNAGKSQRLLDAVTGIFQRAELDADLRQHSCRTDSRITP